MACNFKFRQGTPPACAALSAYWLGLMQEGVRDAKDREGWLRLYKPSGASEKQRVYENACFTTTSVDQGALRTAYAPLANRGFQVRAPTKHPKLNDKAISDLVLYITKNRGSGVLFTFAFSETVLGYAFRHTHTVAFWSEKDAIYLFDADRGEFVGMSAEELVDREIVAMYRKHHNLKKDVGSADDFLDCHFVHYRRLHPLS